MANRYGGSGVSDKPLLLTREQAAELCQTSVEIIDEWSYLPGFPVIRRAGGHFVRIHRVGLERWLEQLASQTNGPPSPIDPQSVRKRAPAGTASEAGVASIQPGRQGDSGGA